MDIPLDSEGVGDFFLIILYDYYLAILRVMCQEAYATVGIHSSFINYCNKASIKLMISPQYTCAHVTHYLDSTSMNNSHTSCNCSGHIDTHSISHLRILAGKATKKTIQHWEGL